MAHALADLRLALQAAGQSGVDVPVLVRTDPLLLLHLGLAHHRAGFHGGVDLVAGAVEEAGVDEHDAVDGFLDAGSEVDCRATLLVHDADLERVLGKPEDLLDAAEQFGGEGNFLGAVLLGLDDVDRAGAAVVERAVGVTDREAVHCTGAGDQSVENALGDLVAVGIEDRGVGHEVTDVADEQQRTTVQAEFAAVDGGVLTVAVERTSEGLGALLDLLGQITAIEAQPVPVTDNLVVGVDSGDRVLEVHDRGDGRFENDVLDTGGVGAADRGGRVDLDLGVQSVVEQQDARRCVLLSEVADELLRLGEGGDRTARQRDLQFTAVDHVLGRICMRPRRERCCRVEEFTRPGDDLVASDLVVAGTLLGAVLLRDGVGAVQRVVQRTPAGVGRVESEARVEDRHDQLRAGRRGDLSVDVRGGDRELGRRRQEVADLLQERLVCGSVDGSAGMIAMPLIDLSLQIVTLGKQIAVLRCELGDDLVGAGPERLGVYTGAGKSLLDHEVVENLGNLKTADLNALSHE